MKAMSLREIAAACGGHYYGEETKLGQKVTYFLAKQFCNIDINELEED